MTVLELVATPEPSSVPMDVMSECRAFLRHPAFAHRLDLNVLTKVASDEKVEASERRKAAEVLGLLYVKVLEVMASQGQQPRRPALWSAPRRARPSHA